METDQLPKSSITMTFPIVLGFASWLVLSGSSQYAEYRFHLVSDAVFTTEGSLLETPVRDLLSCSIACMSTSTCNSFFYNNINNKYNNRQLCVLNTHVVTQTDSARSKGWKYYHKLKVSLLHSLKPSI